jgi:hypothetical protein
MNHLKLTYLRTYSFTHFQNEPTKANRFYGIEFRDISEKIFWPTKLGFWSCLSKLRDRVGWPVSGRVVRVANLCDHSLILFTQGMMTASNYMISLEKWKTLDEEQHGLIVIKTWLIMRVKVTLAWNLTTCFLIRSESLYFKNSDLYIISDGTEFFEVKLYKIKTSISTTRMHISRHVTEAVGGSCRQNNNYWGAGRFFSLISVVNITINRVTCSITSVIVRN